jgi:tetratricopeptide (TPR) repeat protein
MAESRERAAWRSRYGADALLILLTLLAYVPALYADFVWDDFFLIVNNPNMHGFAGLLRTWTEPASVRYPWYPLTTSTFWLEYAAVGLNPLLYHVDNVLLHAANAVLLFRLASALGIPGAWLAGAVFAVHPIHVESVAWITERKNVLAGFFLLLCLHSFARAADLRDVLSPSAEPRPWRDRWLLAALACFVLAMLAKTAVAPAPGALAVLVWLKQGKLPARDLLRLAPFFAVAVVLGAITMSMENDVVGEGQDFIQLAWIERALLYPRALWFYLGKHLLPLHLMFFYPRWEVDAHQLAQWIPLLAAIALIAAACAALRTRAGRGPLAAVLIYGGMLLPASGFFNVLFMFYSFVQNHFVYFASLPLVVLVSALVQRALDRLPRPLARVAVIALVLAPLSALAWSEARTFANEEALWRTSVERNPRAWMALTNLGGLLLERGDFASAERNLQDAIAVNPVDYWAHNNLGIAMARQGRFAEAIPHYEAAIGVMRENPVAWTNLGVALGRVGRRAEAVKAWQSALAIDPNYRPAQQALATWRQGRTP